jgi:hypothetical protein
LSKTEWGRGWFESKIWKVTDLDVDIKYQETRGFGRGENTDSFKLNTGN